MLRFYASLFVVIDHDARATVPVAVNPHPSPMHHVIAEGAVKPNVIVVSHSLAMLDAIAPAPNVIAARLLVVHHVAVTMGLTVEHVTSISAFDAIPVVHATHLLYLGGPMLWHCFYKWLPVSSDDCSLEVESSR
jgi:hypothetical protein